MDNGERRGDDRGIADGEDRRRGEEGQRVDRGWSSHVKAYGFGIASAPATEVAVDGVDLD